MRLTFQPMDAANARLIAGWRYPPPYAMYDPWEGDLDATVAHFTDPANKYYAAVNEHGELIAYRCFGADAQVAGGDYRADALDTGGGMHPDWTGRGLGSIVITAGLRFGRALWAPRAFRVTVAAWNERALRACGKAGFQPVQQFAHARNGHPFIVLVRDA